MYVNIMFIFLLHYTDGLNSLNVIDQLSIASGIINSLGITRVKLNRPNRTKLKKIKQKIVDLLLKNLFLLVVKF